MINYICLPIRKKFTKTLSYNSFFLILILTPLALSSREVKKEIQEAKKWNKQILPCKHENVNINEPKWDIEKLNIIEYSDKNISALLLSIDNSIDHFLSEKRKQSVKKGLSIALPIVSIGLVTYFIIVYFLNPEIEISYQSDESRIIGTDYAKIFSNLSNPSGIAVDTTGNVYVADNFNDRIQKFTSDGNFTKEWGAWGSGPGQFSSPSGVAVDDDIGTVYVADTGNNRIQKFTSDGKHLSDFGEFGYDEDKFNYPMDVDIDSKGHIYVVDSGNNRIQKIEGSSIKTWIPLDESNPIAFDSPISITIDLLDNVYVSDMKNHKIYRFDVTGKNVKAVGEFGFNKQTLLPFWNSS